MIVIKKKKGFFLKQSENIKDINNNDCLRK